MALTLATAMKIASATLEAGAERGAPNLVAVVTDVGGGILVALRSDGAGPFVVEAAICKARTAIGFNGRSSVMAQFFGSDPAGTAGLVGATGGRFLPIAGGVLIHDDNGVLVGAAACGGSTPDNDERFVIAGVTSLGLVVP